MPASYLYGQTLQPIEVQVEGPFRMLVFQLYPFVLSSFFEVDPKGIIDACYDLSKLPNWEHVASHLKSVDAVDQQITIVEDFLHRLFLQKKDRLDFPIKKAIQLVFEQNAQITVKDLADCVHLTVRTFQRRFLKEVALSPKEFIQIVKFQKTFEQLSQKEFRKLSDVIDSNGFADHSHFIRVFKSYTGKTPNSFVNKSLQ